MKILHNLTKNNQLSYKWKIHTNNQLCIFFCNFFKTPFLHIQRRKIQIKQTAQIINIVMISHALTKTNLQMKYYCWFQLSNHIRPYIYIYKVVLHGSPILHHGYVHLGKYLILATQVYMILGIINHNKQLTNLISHYIQ